MLELARAEGMTEVELVTDVENIASQRVVERNGGVRGEVFTQLERVGGGHAYPWRVQLA
jgi:predicted acetyltransferase